MACAVAVLFPAKYSAKSKMTKVLNVMVVGYYGAGNAGDELLLKMILRSLPTESQAIVLSVDPRHTERLHQAKSISLFKLEEVFEQMLKCQLLILGGGGLMQTVDRFTQKGLQQFDENEVSAYIRPFILAKQIGIRTLVWAQGVGPLNTADAKTIVKNVFEHSQAVSVRDEQSLNFLRGMGVTRDILVAPDPVWAISKLPLNKIKANVTKTKKNIVITLRPWPLQTDAWNKILANAMNQCINPDLFRIIWLPFLVTPDDLNQDYALEERKVIEQVQSNLSPDLEQKIIFAKSFDELMASVALADLAISMRLHAQILHHIQCTPVLSVQYDPKMRFASLAAGHDVALCVDLVATASDFENALSKLLHKDAGQMMNLEVKDASVKAATLHFELINTSLSSAAEDHVQVINPIEEIHFDWLKTWLVHQPLLQEHIVKAGLDKALLSVDHLRKEIAQRDIELAHEKQKAQNAIVSLKATWSWRITRPLRFVKYFFRAPKTALYFATKNIYLLLTPSVRHHLAPVRAPLSRWLQGRSRSSQTQTNSLDMSWELFSAQILANRHKFRGVYIQECVIDWNVQLYQRPQHIATAMGRLNYLVIYRTNNWSDDNVNGFRRVAPNVWLTNCEEVDTIETALRSVYSTAVVDEQRLAKLPSNSCIVYEYIDHIDPEISGDSENIKRLTLQKQRMVSGGAHFIVASATKLLKEISNEFDASKVFLIPNGVDVLHYQSQDKVQFSLPDKYIAFRKKNKVCMGYFGALAPWLDYALINELIKLRPDIGFVFIGPDYLGGLAEIKTGENVLVTGAIEYSKLPTYAEKFDVCWIPFKPGEIAKSTSPLKLFEYFALEKPVIVTTDMQECIVYSEVLHGQTCHAISQHIDFALTHQKDDETFQARLRHLAQENDWNHRAAAYIQAYESIKSP